MASGYYPCLRCDIKGISVATTSPVDFKCIQYTSFNNTDATAVTYIQDVKKAKQNAGSVAVACPKGHPAFHQLNVPECSTGDYMHTVFHGPIVEDIKIVVKLKQLSNELNLTIAQVKWPTELSGRILRTTQDFELYKATEWKNLMFYIVIPIFTELVTNSNLSEAEKKTAEQCQNILMGISAVLMLIKDVSYFLHRSKTDSCF